MRATILFIAFLISLHASAQIDLVSPFKDCELEGSTTIYDYKNKKWVMSNSADARVETLPASTFKVINLLIALETGVIKDENEMVKWVGKTDTTLYGYRPDIYKDMTVKEAFEVSAGWVFIELAKKIGKERYKQYLKLCKYGNQNLTQKDADFWNFGEFAISPVNQVEFLTKVYEEKLPFSKRNIAILKRVMVTEKTDTYSIRSKTGWTRVDGNDWGWWVGYVERNDNVYFFATRVIKKRSTVNNRFSQCRKDITKNILKQLKAIE
ncbi:penicillin-binding transpeptidase domain-containing protein [Emticicia fontis]